jgi:hypothetical protein
VEEWGEISDRHSSIAADERILVTKTIWTLVDVFANAHLNILSRHCDFKHTCLNFFSGEKQSLCGHRGYGILSGKQKVGWQRKCP